MDITQMLKPITMNLNLKGANKVEVIDELVELLFSSGAIKEKEGFKGDILKRENISSTGLEEGIAIPHAKSKYVTEPTIAFGKHLKGVDYESLDGELSQLFFMIAVPEDTTDAHVEILSQLTTLLLDDAFRMELLNSKTKVEVTNLLKGINQNNEASISKSKENQSKGYVLGVTACPTGIAHTYMAAKALEKAAQEMGVMIKVETNGSTGIKNNLTSADIEKANGIIVAADKAVEMNRFSGKQVVEVPVKEGIRRPKELIETILNGQGETYSGNNSNSTKNKTEERKGIYKHLMSGVSNMLPFVVGGGILIALSFIWGIDAVNPESESYSAISKFLMDVGGGGAFSLLIPILAGFIGMSIADRPGFMPAMVGGVMASSAGGGFLGGLIAGFAGGYIVYYLKKLTNKLPENFQGLAPVLILPVFGLLLTGVFMYFTLIPVVIINDGITNFLKNLGTGNQILLGVVLGGMMAVDMGGPVNKAAFTFGIAAIEAGINGPHAAVMAGGMVPPLAIAISTTIFKNKYNKEQREAGITNYIMGASFITEGAIPFAAADPFRVLPFCIGGSAIAGGLAMLFGCTLPAPHGGIFVIPLVANPALYILAIVAGSLFAGIGIGATRKNLN